jgi:tricorn protease-like protein
MPSLIDKSRDEVKKTMSVTPKSEDPWLEYDLPQGYLTVWYTKGKQSHLSFKLKPIQAGSQTVSGFATPEPLGDMVGIDVHGKPLPAANGSFYKYEGLKLNGKPRNVTFQKVGDVFSGVSIDFD